MASDKKHFQLLVLQTEIAALLHDIGKFTSEFLEKDDYHKHTHHFVDNCAPELKAVLTAQTPADCFSALGPTRLRSLADLIRWHHEKNFEKINEFFGADQSAGRHLPLEVYLLLYADTLDSAASKSRAGFKKARLRLDAARQQGDKKYLATPFGAVEREAVQADIDVRAPAFQRELAELLQRFVEVCADYHSLVELRAKLLRCLKHHLAATLAETRLPNNDVSLWQHSSSTAAIFKAMLAGHLLRDDRRWCEENGDPAHYRQKLAILGVCWSEERLVGRSFRPAEILGRRWRLDQCVESLKERVEVDYCLGNEIYRDSDGIYFLVPSMGDAGAPIEAVRDAVFAFTGDIDRLINGAQGLAGELAWEARWLEIGLQITRLAEVIGGGGRVAVIAAGPRQPAWLAEWREAAGQEVCPRCGCRPVSLRAVVAGSEGDDAGRVCDHCQQYSHDGGRLRDELRLGNRRGVCRRLLAAGESSDYLHFDINKFFRGPEDGDRRHRLALIQGVVDLRGFLSGRAFSSILTARPEWYDEKTDDKSREMNTWPAMLAVCAAAWREVAAAAGGAVNDQARDTLRQIFHDSHLCTPKDGRVDGPDAVAKARNYLRDVVLAAPFAEALTEEHEKLVNYALRQHPAPSRLARIWEETLAFGRFAVARCEAERIPYSVIAIDARRFQLLVAADRAWSLCHAIQAEYERRFARVRHLLPLHLSATVFYHKAPLYIAIDAARRFSRLGLERSAVAESWKVAAVAKHDDDIQLDLRDGANRLTTWTIPRVLLNGQEDVHYSWCWRAGTPNHPVPFADLNPGDVIAVFPSTFDYEILDSTTRRYDIRLAAGASGRPHLFLKNGGPRPYPLGVLPRWSGLAESLRRVDPSPRKHLVELLAGLHATWRDSPAELRRLAEDAIRNTLGKQLWIQHGPALLDMACDGSFFDLVEWQDFIDR